MNPRYPVYVISKGRWALGRCTASSLERMGVPFNVVIEPQEFDNYRVRMDEAKLLVLPFSNLGQGSIPARNWVWDHAIARGAERHWILDDNIFGFYRFNRNRKLPVASGTIFYVAEDFVERYENVALAGFQYWMFLPRREPKPAIYLNTRIYSCILIKNDLPYRWRGRYNEDTDLSLRALKDGWCTILYNAFVADKAATMTVRGGNTDQLYQGDGRLKMAQSLVDQHPDVVSITRKWGRWQHLVDYRPFRRNRLIPRSGVEIPVGVNNYGMVLQEGWQ